VSDSSVRAWPSYILNGVPVNLRSAISEEARERDVSIAEVVRRILCERYKMECEPVTLRRGGSVGYDPEKDAGAQRIIIRVHPQLFRKIRRDAARRGITMKRAIMQSLEKHYEREAMA
jgi:hypothetical protein